MIALLVIIHLFNDNLINKNIFKISYNLKLKHYVILFNINKDIYIIMSFLSFSPFLKVLKRIITFIVKSKKCSS